MRNDNVDVPAGCFTVIVTIILMFLSPLVGFACGWFIGWVLKWTVGGAVVYGLNVLFNTTRFTSDMLPVVCGVLAIIGSFFKDNSSSSNK